MVRPRYIICSEGRVVDNATNLISHFNVIDQLTVSVPASTPEGRVPVLVGIAIQLSAVWMRENESEKEVEYETEVRLFAPGSNDPQVISPGNFRFGDHYYHRINVAIQPGPPGEAMAAIEVRQGMMRLECRIRPVGETDWISQDYSIPVRVKRLDSEQNGSPASDEPS